MPGAHYVLKIMPMPRRIPDYPDAYLGWNMVSSVGSIISVVATGIFLYTIYDMLVMRREAADNAWAQPGYFVDSLSFAEGTSHSTSLEWVVPTPTPLHAFNMVPLQS